MSSLNTQNYALLTCNYGISTSCCHPATGFYWDGVPCGADYPYRTICAENDQCVLDNRVYISHTAKCDGTTNKVCECQLIYIEHPSDIYDNPSSVLAVSLTAGTGYIEVTPTTIVYTSSAATRSRTLSLYTIDTLRGIIDAHAEWVCNAGSTPLDTNCPSRVLATGFYAIPATTTVDIPARRPEFTLSFSGNTTDPISFTTDNTPQLLTDVADAIGSAGSMPGQITCYLNENYRQTDDLLTIECVWNGTSQCGIGQPPLSIADMLIPYSANYSANNVGVEAATGYKYGWMNFDEHYSRLGSGTYNAPDYFGSTNQCLYECDQYYHTTDANDGPFPYDEGIQCCPQRGCMIGPNQNLSDGGYNVGARWSNLENTIRVNGDCYSMSPFWFLFGKNGRFDREHNTSRTAHILPDCDYRTECTRVPPNCAVDAFIPQFHQDVPWGVFGSYYYRIETATHPTNNDSDTYIGLNDADRKGWDYKPKGWVLTRGEWTKTKEIELYAVVHRAVPFYKGAEEFDEINLMAQLDTSTTTAFSSVSAGNGCGPVGLVFDTEGQTVGDFIDAVNGVRLAGTDVQPTGCNLFAFCVASSSVRQLPASWIINTSAELFDLANVQGGYSASNGSARPDIDERAHDGQYRLFSGSDIRVGPLEYNLMWPRRSGNTISAAKVYNYNPDPFYSNKAKLPPMCRHRLGPRYDASNQTWRSQEGTINSTLETPWWQIMAGSVDTLLTVNKSSDVPGYIHPLNVAVTGQLFVWSAVSGVTTVATGYLDTLQGTGYTQYNLATGINNIVINDGTSTYRGFAASVVLSETVYVDDDTYWDGSNIPCSQTDPGAVLTPMNWSYREPVLDADTVDLATSSLNIQSFRRRNCDATGVFTQYPCVPPEVTTYGGASFMDCHSDSVADANFIYTYGCGGYICQTQWYLQASRCGCSTQYYCEVKGQAPHKYNREGDDEGNAYIDTIRSYAITQPILYVCAENFHHQCDITTLIKVPFQIVGTKAGLDSAAGGDVYGTSVFAETPGETKQVYYCEDNYRRHGVLDGEYERAFTPLMSCSDNATPSVYHGVPMVPFNSECRGWCQYINPAVANRVPREQIPKTWPPTAYRMDRAGGVFCSVNPYSAPISEICDNSASPTQLELGWDTLEGLVPNCKPEHVNPDTGYPYVFGTNFLFGYNGLHCYTRPAINPLTEGELCESSEVNRLDINCATKCCECDFKCDPDTGEYTDGPYTCPCAFSITVEMTNTKDGILYECDYTQFPGGMSQAACVVGCCQNGPYRIAGKYGGTYGWTETMSMEYDGNSCCVCDESEVTGSGSVTYDTAGVSCSGPCGPEGEFVFRCNTAEPICPMSPYICENTIYTPPSCANLYNPTPAWEEGTTTGYIFARDGFGGCSDDLCAYASDTQWSRNMTSVYGFCGAESHTWTGSATINYNGTSAYDGASLGYTLDGSTYETGTGTESYQGSYVKTAPICAACTVGSMTNTKTLAYITGWIDAAEIGCGDGNILYRSGTATGVYGSLC